MQLTVGKIEEQLRKFPKGTLVNVGCGCCNHSASGDESMLKIEDNTNQTYDYIEMQFNSSSQSELKLNPDEKEFYECEVKKLKEEIKKLHEIIEDYVEGLDYVVGDIARLNRILDRKADRFITKIRGEINE